MRGPKRGDRDGSDRKDEKGSGGSSKSMGQSRGNAIDLSEGDQRDGKDRPRDSRRQAFRPHRELNQQVKPHFGKKQRFFTEVRLLLFQENCFNSPRR